MRRATPGEKLETLDGQVRTLDPEDLLITDESGPIGLAGVMGGGTTEMGDATRNVLIEAATFDPVSIARTARRHKLPSARRPGASSAASTRSCPFVAAARVADADGRARRRHARRRARRRAVRRAVRRAEHRAARGLRARA